MSLIHFLPLAYGMPLSSVTEAEVMQFVGMSCPAQTLHPAEPPRKQQKPGKGSRELPASSRRHPPRAGDRRPVSAGGAGVGGGGVRSCNASPPSLSVSVPVSPCLSVSLASKEAQVTNILGQHSRTPCGTGLHSHLCCARLPTARHNAANGRRGLSAESAMGTGMRRVASHPEETRLVKRSS